MTKFRRLIVLGLTTSMMSVTLANAGIFQLSQASTVFADTEEKNYTINSAYWDNSDERAIAYWDETESKTSYKVQLFKGNKKIGNVITVSKETYDFSTLVAKNGTGSYTFKVYPAKGNKTKDLVTSDILGVDSDYLTDIKKSVGSTPNSSNSINDKNEDSSKGPGVPKGNPTTTSTSTTNINNGWNLVNNVWYYQKADSNLAKNEWLSIEQKWYHFSENGQMQIGWLKDNDKWYYLDLASGSLKTGWEFINGKWYYLSSPNGDLLVNTTTPDNFRVNENGERIE